MIERAGDRGPNQLRPTRITRDYLPHAEGPCMIEMGNTHVICTASIANGVPRWLKGSGQGWITAEYGMLPRSTGSRMGREAARGKQSGRTQEIQRLIGLNRQRRFFKHLQGRHMNVIQLIICE